MNSQRIRLSLVDRSALLSAGGHESLYTALFLILLTLIPQLCLAQGLPGEPLVCPQGFSLLQCGQKTKISSNLDPMTITAISTIGNGCSDTADIRIEGGAVVGTVPSKSAPVTLQTSLLPNTTLVLESQGQPIPPSPGVCWQQAFQIPTCPLGKVCDGPPPAVVGNGDHNIQFVEAHLGGPSIYLKGYGIYTPPTSPPQYDPLCRVSDEDGNRVGFYPQCLPTSDPSFTYMVLLTAAVAQAPAPNEWQHSLYCLYGQAFGGGGIATDTVVQTSGGNNNGKYRGVCVAGGLAAAAGSISATVSDVPSQVPKQGAIVKIGLEVTVAIFTTPTWGCLASVNGTEEWLYFGCSSSGVFNAFAFGNAIAMNF